MHIEPGVVDGAKIILSYGTATFALGIAAKAIYRSVQAQGVTPLLAKSILCALLVFSFFEVLPHHPIGVSEVHFILGSTLFLLFGIAPAAIGLSVGLLIQSVFLAPIDLPQYGMNMTTLLLPLFAMGWVAQKIIPQQVAYKDLTYAQTLKLSLVYQGGIISWVAFWAFYGQGFSSESLFNVGTFCAAYASVIVLEPIVDLSILALAKLANKLQDSPMVEHRLFHAAS